MPGSRRLKRTVAAFLGGGVALLAAAALFGDGPIRACSTVGYLNLSPIELHVDPNLQVDEVTACFGTDCRPVAVPGAGSEWSVPQSPEYLQSVEPGSITHVTVQATSAGEVVVDRVVDIPRQREGGVGWPECPGPYRYLPVSIAG